MRDTRAEMHVLAGVLDGVMGVDEVAAMVDEECFDENGRPVFDAMLCGAVTPSTLKSFLKDPAAHAYIDSLAKTAVNRSEMEYFVEKIRDLNTKRLIGLRARKVAELAEQESTTVRDLSEMMSFTIHEEGKKDILLPADYATKHKANFEARTKDPMAHRGIPLCYDGDKGFPQLNKTFMGLRGGDLILAAAESGHGKTALALNIARALSVHQSYVSYYLNTEMDDEELSGRLVAQISGVPFEEIYTGELHPRTMLFDITSAYDKLAESKIVLSKIPILTVTKAKGLAKMVRQKMEGLDCLIVDYLGRLEPEKTQGLQEWQQLYQTAERLKTLAVELDKPVIVLAQLTGAGMLEGAKKIKNACDGVVFFQPKEANDAELLEQMIGDPDKRKLANYKLVKYKVRRNDNSLPIWCNFYKKTQRVVEIS